MSDYSSLSNVTKLVSLFRTEYTRRLIILDKSLEKVYQILQSHSINPRIVDNMEFMTKHDFNVFFQLFDSSIIFAIDIQMQKPSTGPYIKFILKNPKTNYTIEESINLSDIDPKLSPKFILYFRNNFASYFQG